MGQELITCRKCGEPKPETEYYRRKTDQAKSKAGSVIQKKCKRCVINQVTEWREKNKEHVSARNKARYAENREEIRETQRDRRYGLAPGEYNRMLSAQSGVCAVCGGAPEENCHGKLFVDHCHLTGRNRGLLCTRCNVAIGMLRDDPELLGSAARYLMPERS